jgi:cell division protein DivIC
MAKAKSKTGKRKQTKSFILTLGIILLVGYFVITIVGNVLSYKERQGELEQKNAAYEAQIEENDRLQEIVNSEDKSDYIEKVAREKLGFIMPGEKVFYDVTPGA